ncbi:MAG: hypothetical protein HC789_22915, partial [Microcoleus sp. CSU_2_2]|nr:hypothetical protein [Microcoleus sp. CSU_2_2]
MATFTVNSSSDTINPNDGVTTLREAITFAANNPGRDTILFNSSVVLNSSLPTLQTGNDIDFIGNFANRGATINGNNRQIFTINGANVSFTNLTIRNGVATGGSGTRGGGGGLGSGGALFINRGNVITDSVTFSNNFALGGSGSNGRGDGNSGGNDSGNGQTGFAGGSGGNFNNLSDAALNALGLGNGAGDGGGGGAGGRILSNGNGEGGGGGGFGSSGSFGSGGGSGGGA